MLLSQDLEWIQLEYATEMTRMRHLFPQGLRHHRKISWRSAYKVIGEYLNGISMFLTHQSRRYHHL